MALAFKVAGNSSGSNKSFRPKLEPVQKHWLVRGYWPRYKVGIVGEIDFDGWVICWGKRNLQAHLVSLRVQGIKPFSYTGYRGVKR